MPPIQLTKASARKLLSVVAGKPHATDEDHDERWKRAQERATTPVRTKLQEFEDRLSASPLSSSDEAVEAVKQRSPTPPAPTVTTNPRTNSKSRVLDASKAPVRRNSGRNVSIKAPAKGKFAQNEEERRRRNRGADEDEEKENEGLGSSAQSVVGKRSVEAEDDGPKWGIEHSTMKKQKTPYSNIHAPPPGQSANRTKNFAASGASRGSAASSKAPTRKKIIQYGKKTQVREQAPTDDEDDDLSDISMAELDTSLLKTKKKTKRAPTDAGEDELLPLDGETIAQSPPAKLAKPSLLEQLADYRRDQTPTTSQPTGSGNTSNPNFDPDVSNTSSPLSSPGSAHRAEAIQDVEKYMVDLPEEAPEVTDKCPLCEEPVKKSDYLDFWIGKKKTVFYQTLFCKEHKRRKALKEYRDKGYPEIDWEDFPSKIRDYHPRLKAVLRNEKPSEYREKHAQRLADRDARAVRKQLDSDAAYESTTGYYGSRGKRAMMEGITSQLGPVIKECVERDPVVAFNGFATFVQSVLVPELTVWMIMDDNDISEKKAREIVQESGALGEIVNEEVEDRVAVLESEDESELDELDGFVDSD